MEDFTPDTERVKAAAVEIAPITGAEFDRWLERVKREAGAAALRDFAQWAKGVHGSHQWFTYADAYSRVILEEGE